MNLRFRLFDNGIGFRYELPEQAEFKTAKIADEVTEFAIAPKGTAWWITGGESNRYEQVDQKTRHDTVATAPTPSTIRLDDDTHLAFQQAAVVAYSGLLPKAVAGRKHQTTQSTP